MSVNPVPTFAFRLFTFAFHHSLLLLTRLDLETSELKNLAPYATLSRDATRAHPETLDEFRTAFQRDRDRIIHAKSFRRLKGKTQVFVAHYGDHFRNRLSHTLEVAQLSRDIARSLGANEDLAESIALAHDLGHTPFGHVGERKLNELLRPFGESFEHNRQSQRILEKLEKKYPYCDGLNLTHALLDGLAKHQSEWDQKENQFVAQPSLEAQIVNFADEIAYSNHDLDDGLRAHIFSRTDLRDVPLWQNATAKIDSQLPEEAFIHRSVSALIHVMVNNLLTNTHKHLMTHGIDTPEKIKHFGRPLVEFSITLQTELITLRKFLYEHFYLAPPVVKKSAEGARIIEELFGRLIRNPRALPEEFAIRLDTDPTHIIVADFIAGMTDSYALEFLENLI